MKTIGFFVILLASLIANAQDTLVKEDESVEIVRVLEVNPQTIKYKRFQSLNGPDYVVDKHQVRMIAYANGIRELFQMPLEVKPQEKLSHLSGVFYLGGKELKPIDFDQDPRLFPIKPLADRTRTNSRLSKVFGLTGIPLLIIGTVSGLIGGVLFELVSPVGSLPPVPNEPLINNLLTFAACTFTIGLSFEIGSIANSISRHARVKKAKRIYNASFVP